MRRAPLWPDRVLGDLDQHGVAGLQRVFDPALLALEVDGFPVDFTGVEHGVAAASDVDEGGFHRRQHVLDLAQVDVADQGILLGLRDEVLGQDAVLEDADLDSVVALADDHLAVHGFAPGQELGLGDDGAAAAGIAGFAAALLLRLQPGGALEGRDAVVDRGLGGRTGRADPGHRVGRIVVLPAGQFEVLVAAAAATAAARGHAVLERPLGAFFCFVRFVAAAFGRIALGTGLAVGPAAAASAASAAAAATAASGVLAVTFLALFFLSLCDGGGRRRRAHDGGQVGCLEDHRGDRSRLQEQRGGGGGRFGRRFCGFRCCRGSGFGCCFRGLRRRLPRPASRRGFGGGGLSGSGFSGGGASAAARLSDGGGGLGAAGAAADRLLNGRFGGLGCRGLLRRQPRRRRLRRRQRRPAGVRPARRPCGRGCGVRGPWPWLRRREPLRRLLPRRELRRPRRRRRVRAASRGFLLRQGLAAGPDRPLRRYGYSRLCGFYCFFGNEQYLRYPLQPGHYPYVAILLPLTCRHIRHPLGQIFVNTRRH